MPGMSLNESFSVEPLRSTPLEDGVRTSDHFLTSRAPPINENFSVEPLRSTPRNEDGVRISDHFWEECRHVIPARPHIVSRTPQARADSTAQGTCGLIAFEEVVMT